MTDQVIRARLEIPEVDTSDNPNEFVDAESNSIEDGFSDIFWWPHRRQVLRRTEGEDDSTNNAYSDCQRTCVAVSLGASCTTVIHHGQG